MVSTTATTAGAIICAGLSCLDLQLLGCTKSGTEEAIEQYDEAVYCAGGSASMTATTLALLTKTNAEEEEEEEEEEDVRIHVLTKLGADFNGDKLIDFYKRAGANTDLILVDPNVRTSMAVLPVFSEGGRGCFVNLACNEGFTASELLERIDMAPVGVVRAFLFGYPHLLPGMQGDTLRTMLESVRRKLGTNCLVGVDLNGVGADNHNDGLLSPALTEVDILHLNEEEAAVLCAEGNGDATTLLHDRGCAVVILSLGSRGAKISVTSDAARLKRCPGQMKGWTPGSTVRVPAFHIGEDQINANGAGDALFSGFCFASSMVNVNDVNLEQAGTFASLVAWQRCNIKTRDGDGMLGSKTLMDMVQKQDLPANPIQHH
eukprot:CAMPEP_0195510468 /NCGR_PEP_ID=MMETSP0794_2-20130614/3104_1 /TAXON_ID=515487 /ORGANISM="Stephanopyxis turris, Strain CCMP 815" /LENGTH=374 /DNA_ID=CAMNT_0040637895 /DNA_START=142 /DNA_END=1266 /DNA_ORIENTATION=-